mgnify:CR=1 FL=1
MTWKPGDSLPNAQRADIDLRKFEEYSMNPDNPANQGKWMAFAAIGYDVQNAQGRNSAAKNVVSQLRQQLASLPATQGQGSLHGLRFEVRAVIQGINGRKGTLITIWQIDAGRDILRLITNWLEVYRELGSSNES